MPKTKRLYQAALVLLISLGILHLTIFPALAAEEAAEWRPFYDKIMLWVNFAILVFLVFRYGREPFKNFLKGQRDEVAKEIHDIEEKKQQMQEMIADTERKIAESSVRFEKIKIRITNEGQQLKKQIIDNARDQGQKLLELEKKKAASRIDQARAAFMAELVDAATKHAQNRLPDEITDADHQKYLDLYLSNMSRMAG